MATSPAQPIPSDDDWDDLSIDDRIIEEVEAGQSISGEAVKRWILSWGTENELPAPKVGD